MTFSRATFAIYLNLWFKVNVFTGYDKKYDFNVFGGQYQIMPNNSSMNYSVFWSFYLNF